VRGSYGRARHRGARTLRQCGQAYRAALIWYVTGDRAYADKAIEIIHGVVFDPVGFSTTTTRTLLRADRRLMVQRRPKFLRYTTRAEKGGYREFERMLRTFISPCPLLFSEANGNWDAAHHGFAAFDVRIPR